MNSMTASGCLSVIREAWTHITKTGKVVALAVALQFPHDLAADGFEVNPAPLDYVVTFNGPILHGVSASEFRTAIRGETVNILRLSSVGGSLREAMLIADMVHDLGIDTWIMEGEECASACAIVFLAGRERFLFGRLGVHQFVRVDRQGTDVEAQSIVAELIDLMAEFDAPIEVLRQMMATPPDQMHWYDDRHLSVFMRSEY